MSEAARFDAAPFTVAGLAYDAVSDRFIFGDRGGRKLFIVGSGARHSVDLVRADSAGFQDILAFDIDAARGDLWTLSGAPGGGSALHRVQLVSGRPLRAFPIDVGPVDLVDLAVARDGAVLVLDAATGRLLHLSPGAAALEVLVRLDVQGASSLTASNEEGILFVSHRDGLSRVDLRARRVSPVSAPAGTALSGFQRLRRYRNSLVALRTEPDGSQQAVRLTLSARGTEVTKVTKLDVRLPAGETTRLAIAGDDLLFAVAAAKSGTDAVGPTRQTTVVVYRVRLSDK
jgi:hypothetical protein